MNYTSIEQSKKLLELGLSPESADMWWDETEKFPRCIKHYHEYLSQKISPIPCWTIGALLEIIPKKIQLINENNYAEFIIAYPSYSDGHSMGYNRGDIPWKYGDTLLDTCYEMVVWLLENNYIEKAE